MISIIRLEDDRMSYALRLCRTTALLGLFTMTITTGTGCTSSPTFSDRVAYATLQQAELTKAYLEIPAEIEVPIPLPK